jgi:membrane-associated phospholipid phosphatase
LPVTLAVLGSGLVVAVVMFGLARVRRGPGLLDPERAEHWLITSTQRHRRLERLLRSADRNVAGGAAVAVTFAAVWAAALGVGWLLDTVDTAQGFARWDQSVAAWGAEHATPLSTKVLRAATRLGDTPVVLLTMGLVALLDVRRHRDRAVIGYLATVGVGVVVLNNSLKLLVARGRPPVDHLVGSAGFSFPSGHAATAAACWAAIVLILERSIGRRVRAALLVGVAAGLAFLVAASRALLGVHWLTDVIAGLIVGWAWFFLVSIIFGGRVQRFADPLVALEPPPHAVPARDDAGPRRLRPSAGGTPHGAVRPDGGTNGTRGERTRQ